MVLNLRNEDALVFTLEGSALRKGIISRSLDLEHSSMSVAQPMSDEQHLMQLHTVG